ncbi:VOC family protein [Sphingomonas sp. KR1UV-12]|uniref:VOC family protein n=1 Tax=Sphingomonas aurea TaxID=3063994 RepID=A0ABT9EKP7_9SPHN|nr:VOC family protein [Sphingomonas sp. KR1UV-12]MDP1027412.1 VOC family protein [Sphingomonas sp. KR1UV-12]
MGTLGNPVWFELVTSDPDAAQRFYADVVGWTIAPGEMPGMDYRILSARDGDRVGGLMPRPAGMEAAPVWLVYIGCDDVDRTVAAAQAKGAALQLPPMDVPGAGRLAMLADPQGNPFYVMHGEGTIDSRAFEQHGNSARPGHAVWTELSTPDQDAGIAFYADLFGWRQDGAMPMGPLGEYKFLYNGDAMVGAAMRTTPGAPNGWQSYFLVPDIDAAVGRVAAGGGTLIQGPDEIPGGAFSAVLADPQGARFGLVGTRGAAA